MGELILILMMGLPKSGRSVYALKLVDRGVPVVSIDAIRKAMYGQRFIAEMEEPYVWATAKTMVNALFIAGHWTVAVDTTNMTKEQRDFWKSDIYKRKIKYIDTPVNECLRRANEQEDWDIMPIIGRMGLEFEPIEESEGLEIYNHKEIEKELLDEFEKFEFSYMDINTDSL